MRVVAGKFGEHASPVKAPTDVSMLDISLDAEGEISIPVDSGQSIFVLPIFGSVMVDGRKFGLDDLQVPLYTDKQSPQKIKLQAAFGPAKVMIFADSPLQHSTI